MFLFYHERDKNNNLLNQQDVLDKHFLSLEQEHSYPARNDTAFDQVGIK